MICKWCGATVSAGGKKCTRCGREIPALSDCGGFYDLVPNPGGVAVPVAVPAAPVAPPPPSPEELARRAAAKKKAEQMALIRLGVFALVALVIVVMLIVVMVRLSAIDARLDAVEKDVAMLDNQLADHLEEKKPDFEQLPEQPSQNQDEKPVDKPKPEKPENPPTQPTTEEPQEPEIPEPPVEPLESWGFVVDELPANKQMFVDDIDEEGFVSAVLHFDGGRLENGVCFIDTASAENGVPNPNRLDVLPVEENGIFTLQIKISGTLVHHYAEFRGPVQNDDGVTEIKDAICTPEGEVTVKDCQLTEDEDSVIYTMEVTEDIYLFFAEIEKNGGNAGVVCEMRVNQTNADNGKNQTFSVAFQPDTPDDDAHPEVDDNAPDAGDPGDNTNTL